MITKLAFVAAGVVSISLWSHTEKLDRQGQVNSTKTTRYLSYAGKELLKIPNEIYNYQELNELNLSRNDLKVLSPKLRSLHTLTKINLSNNPQLDIETVVNNLPDSALIGLNLEACNLYVLPIGMERFQKLKSLDLSNNYLTNLPYDFSALSYMEQIDLSGNQLYSIDQCAHSWWSLKHLDLSDNPNLDHKSTFLALSYLDELEYLKVDNLGKLDKDFSELNCQHLVIASSPSLDFNNQLRENSNIQKLTLDHSLRKHPARTLEEVNACINLRELKLLENWLKVPKYIKELNTITSLDLSGNQLLKVENLKQLTGLKNLNLSNNPLSDKTLSDLQEALPNCKIRFDKEMPVKKGEIKKPIPELEVPEESQTVNPKKAQEIEFSSAKLSIPQDAFLDKDGNVIKTPVKLDYQEMMNPAQIMLSGVPMSYDSAGTRYNFSSAGMFKINATSNGQQVFPNPDQPIEMAINSTSMDTDYNLYAYDSTTGNWQNLGKDEVEPLSSNRNRTLDEQAFYDEALNTYLSTVGAYRSAFMRNRMIRPKFRTRVRKNKKTASFTIALENLPLLNIKTSAIEGHSQVKTLSRSKWIYEGANTKETFKYLNSISDWMDKKYKKMRTAGAYSKNGPSFIKNVSLKPAEDANTFVLSFQYKDTVLHLNVYPEMTDYSSKRQANESKMFYKRYKQKLKRDQRQNERLQRKIKRKDKSLLQSMKKNGIDLTLEELMEYDTKAMRQKMMEEGRLNAYLENTLAKPVVGTRLFQLTGFGVFNCDRIQRMAQPQRVLARFVDGQGQAIKAEMIYILEFDVNGVLAYNGNESFYVDKGTDYNIVFMLSDGRVAIARSLDLQDVALSSRGSKVPTNIQSTKGKSAVEIVEMLMS